MASTEASEALQRKEEGNKYFQAGDYAKAAECYTAALKLCPASDKKDHAVFYKNRAACHLKLENWQKAADDATESIEIVPADSKARFRRAQAYDHLEKYDVAFKDARAVLHLDKNNKAVLPLLEKLSAKLQEKSKEQHSTNSRVSQMLQALFDPNADTEKRSAAANNLIVLGRDAPAQLFQGGGVKMLLPVLEWKEEEYVLAVLRTLDGMCINNQDRAKVIVAEVGFPRLQQQLTRNSEEICLASAHLILNVVCALTGLNREAGNKVEMAKLNANIKMIGSIMKAIMHIVTDVTLSGYGRDAVTDLILKLVPRTGGIDWVRRFLDDKACWEMLKVGSCIPEMTTMPITSETRGHIALALNNIYMDLESDSERAIFRTQCEDYIMVLIDDPSHESKVKCVIAITTLLQGPFDVGNSILGTKGMLEIMLVMAGSDDVLQQQVSVEAIIQASTKADKSAAIISQGTPILKKLYQSKNENIKVRALAALCKAGSSGGTDASAKAMSEGSTIKLADSCLKFLRSSKKDMVIRKFAAEGLAYLTLDAEVKEKVSEDEEALKSIIELGKHTDEMGVYGVSSVFVNLTNSYDKQEVLPEMVELAKFAKRHVPEEDVLDEKEYVDKRVSILVKCGIVSSLVGMCKKTKSQTTNELIARVFFTIAENKEHRGYLVQQGGAKALLPLTKDNTSEGKKFAAHGLARIGITTNPENAFPGQRACEVVRPLIGLLHPDHTGLANFEALMALTNLAALSASVRQKILKEEGFSKIEHWCFEEHELIRRAATQCMLNLMQCKEVEEIFLKPGSDRFKLMLLYAGEFEDDVELALAGAAIIAMLTTDERCIEKVKEVKSWLTILSSMSMQVHTELQYRGLLILANIIEQDRDLANEVTEGQMLDVLMALTQQDDFMRAKAKEQAVRALAAAQKWELIQKNPDAE
ncbi:PREDICTED: protein unc-45 homolog B-like [Priapulus caudatus]|uniref:Protein unc-45 homolog B-like n=1 Tax=Priapulus caudatus TaxID=37621 RepID=A0ABM1EQ08_PRICU|nr:PREDICTED: protein unc-45 homolog B-like [Priapulus caudatus]